MLIILSLWFLALLYMSVRTTRTAIRAWKGGSWKSRIIYTLVAAYFWYRTLWLGWMLWDIIGGAFALFLLWRNRKSAL